jgi:hypothetical protein
MVMLSSARCDVKMKPRKRAPELPHGASRVEIAKLSDVPSFDIWLTSLDSCHPGPRRARLWAGDGSQGHERCGLPDRNRGCASEGDRKLGRG